MKNIFLILITIVTISCKAQTVPLNTYYDDTNIGAYFKDTYDEMNRYTGTWQFTNANDTLTIVIQKKTHVYDGEEYYEDLLIGEYRYVSNGIEIVNTLPLLSNFSIIGREHNISGKYQIGKNIYLACSDCNNNEKRFMLNFWDPDRIYLSLSIVLRYLPISLGEPEKLTATLIANNGVILPNANSPTEARVPYGEYLMIKQ